MLNIELKQLEIENIPQISAIHIAAFPESALSKLGEGAVYRYYHWLLTGPHDSLSLGAFNKNELYGFCFSGVFNGAMSGFLKMNHKYLLLRVLTHPWLISNSLFRQRLNLGMRVLRRNLQSQRIFSNNPITNIIPQPKKQYFVILDIATLPKYQGYGIGSRLLHYCERFAIDRDYDEMRLSVNLENIKAQKFYTSKGWEYLKIDGKWDGRMYKRIIPDIESY